MHSHHTRIFLRIFSLVFFLLFSVNLGAGDPATDDLAPFGSYASGSSGAVVTGDFGGKGPGVIFSYSDGQDILAYYLLQNEFSQGALTIHVKYNDYEEIIPVFKGGTLYRDSRGQLLQPDDSRRKVTLLKPDFDGKSLTLLFAENDQPQNTFSYTITIKGRTLVIDASSDSSKKQYLQNYGGTTLGSIQGFQQDHLNINYMMLAPINIVLDNSQRPLYFYTLYYDPTQTNGQNYERVGCGTPTTDPCYIKFTYSGRRNNSETLALQERIYLTVSDTVDDTLVKINNPPSPYKGLLQTKTQLDIYGTGLFSRFNKDALGLQWTAPAAGQALLKTSLRRTGRAGDYLACAPISLSASEGVQFTILQNNAKIFADALPGQDLLPEEHTLQLQVAPGDTLRFLLSAPFSNLCEDTQASISILLNGKEYSYPQQFSTVQGKDGWEYIAFIDGVYQQLSFDTRLRRWQTPEYKSYISDHSISPPSYRQFSYVRGFVEELSNLGISNLVFFLGDHHKDGFDTVFPAAFPSNPIKGGVTGVQAVASAVKRDRTNLFSLYFIPSWISQSPVQGSPAYFTQYYDHILKDNSGTPASRQDTWINGIMGRCPGGLDVCFEKVPGQADLLCPFNGYCYKGSKSSFADVGKMITSSPGRKPLMDVDIVPAEQAYDLTAVYIDVLAANSPAWQIDSYEVDSQVKSISDVLRATKNAFTYVKQGVGGPVNSEGSSMQGWKNVLGGINRNEQRMDVLYAGYVDGMSFPPDFAYRDDITLIPDFAQKSINPLMVPDGVGLRGRVYNHEKQFNLDESDCKPDFYRALELAYGFANHLDDTTCTTNPFNHYPLFLTTLVKEYYLVNALQKEYRASPVAEILYESNGRLVDLSEALREGVDFADDKVSITYQNGFQMYVNFDRGSTWTIRDTPKGTITLPTYGFVAWKRGGVFGASYLQNGRQVDYVESPEYTLADGRGVETDFFGELSAAYLEIALTSGATIFCQVPFGCYKNYRFTPLTSVQVPAGTLLSTAATIPITGANIHPDARLYYLGREVDHSLYKVVDGAITLYSDGNRFRSGIGVLEVRNPGDQSAFVTTAAVPPRCGDGVCNGQETCSTCSQDCGRCKDDQKKKDQDTIRKKEPVKDVGDLQKQVGDGQQVRKGEEERTIIRKENIITSYKWHILFIALMILTAIIARIAYVKSKEPGQT